MWDAFLSRVWPAPGARCVGAVPCAVRLRQEPSASSPRRRSEDSGAKKGPQARRGGRTRCAGNGRSPSFRGSKRNVGRESGGFCPRLQAATRFAGCGAKGPPARCRHAINTFGLLSESQTDKARGLGGTRHPRARDQLTRRCLDLTVPLTDLTSAPLSISGAAVRP